MRQSSTFAVTLLIFSLAIFLTVWPGKALGVSFDTLFLHTDDNDPTTEGWTKGQGSAFPDSGFGPIVNDGGSGFDAWKVDDNSSGFFTTLFYLGFPTDAQIAQGMAFGWKLSWRLRVVDIPDAVNGVDIEYNDGTTAYTAVFGSDSSGDPIVLLADGTVSGGVFTGGPSYTASGSGYHLYELIFDPIAGSADLLVDGVERISDYTGHSQAVKRVFWGAGGSITTGQGNWNMVEFAVATPEPATLLLLGTGLAGLGIVRRRRKI